jgi:hypothetical protein
MTGSPGNDGTETTADHGGAYPVTYEQAAVSGRWLTEARDRYEELTGRRLAAKTVATLRQRGQFDPSNTAHTSLAERQPLSARDHLELLAAGEVLARYYRHPAAVHDAVRAGATWEQVAAARGTDETAERRRYREWAEGQRQLAADYPQFGMNQAEFAEALDRAADAATSGPGIPAPDAEASHPAMPETSAGPEPEAGQ